MAIMATDKGAFDIADGIYQAALDDYEETEPHPKYGPGIKLIWKLADGNEKWQFCSQKLSPKSTLQGVVKALGFEPVPGTAYELDELLMPLCGRPAQLVIKTGPTADGTGESQRVTDVIAMRGGAPQMAPVTEAALCAAPGCVKPYTKFNAIGIQLCDEHAATGG